MSGKPNLFRIYTLIIAALAVLFISCSQNLPEVTTTDYSVIFDYSDDENPPQARLAVFATSDSDVRRYQKIMITSLETGYCWESDLLVKLDSGDGQYAGCTNLVAPEDENLPSGLYEIIYFNADEKECKLQLEIKYDIEFYDVLLSALPEIMAEKHGIDKIAVYDKDHILIYYGERTEELKTTRDIWNQYREAKTYQVIWCIPDGSLICVTPEKPVSPEEDNAE